jgi:tetratricopeptide (TPR) repeat protein
VLLAVRIPAARLRSRPTWTLAELNARLGADDRLDQLVAGARGMAAALDTSVEQLDESHRRAYDLLGLATGPDLGLDAASVLVGLAPRRTRAVLDALVECHLLDEVAPDRFGMHALVREHAERRASTPERAAEASAAVRRLLDHYVAAGAAVVRVAYPYLPVPPAGDAVELEVPTHREAARRWLDDELDNLLAAAATAREQGLDQHVVDLSGLLDRHLSTTARHRPAVPLHQAAVGSARRTGDRVAEALALTRLAYVRRRLDLPTLAATLYRRGLAVAREVGNHHAAATALVGLANLLRRRDDYEGARSRLSEALSLARTTDDALLLPEILSHLGHVHRQCGNIEAADECLTEAIRLTRRDRHDQVQLNALVNLGYIRLAMARDDQAADVFAQALELAREDGHLFGEAAAHLGLGHVLLRRGDHTRAIVCFQEVEALAERLGSRNWRFEAALGSALASREVDPARAVERGNQALETARAMGQRTDVARAHDVVASALARLGDRSGAAQHWDRALELLTDLGVEVTEDGHTSVASISRQRAQLDDPRPAAAGD